MQAKKAPQFKNSVRVVGTRQIPAAVVDVVAADQTDADGTVGLTEDQIRSWLRTDPDTYADVDSQAASESEQETDEETAAREAQFEKMREDNRTHVIETIENLKPASFATFIALGDAIPDDLKRQVIAGRHLCVIARLPSSFWVEPARVALKSAINLIQSSANNFSSATVGISGTEQRPMRREFDLQDVVASLNRSHLIVPLLPHETIEPAIYALSDLELDLYPTGDRLLAAMKRRFPEATSWDGHILPRCVRPETLNLACERATSAKHAFALLHRLVPLDIEADLQEQTSSSRPSDTSTKKSTTAISPTFPTSPKLGDLHGYGSIGTWAQDLCDDLAAYKSGDLAWSDVDTGCLIYGPPGTGKTLFASALAASSGLPFFATSFAQWQGSRGGHLGDVVRSMREWFAAASAAAPSIMFIDELDSIPSREGSHEYQEYWVPIVNALLELLDGTSRREGLVVIAACNNPGKIDPAITRSGRLDRRFELGLPGEDDLVRIFGHHLPDLSSDVVGPVATVLAGSCSGADVARIAREARRSARREKRDLVANDLLAIAMPEDERPEDYRRLAAVHEAGHAIAMIASGQVPELLSLVQNGQSQGRVRQEGIMGLGRITDVEREVVTMLAGRAAEEVVLGHPSIGASNDLANATTMVKRTIGITGLGGRLAYSENVDGHVVEERLRELYGRALRLIGQHRAHVEALAELALERRVLPKRALAEFAAGHGFEVAR